MIAYRGSGLSIIKYCFVCFMVVDSRSYCIVEGVDHQMNLGFLLVVVSVEQSFEIVFCCFLILG